MLFKKNLLRIYDRFLKIIINNLPAQCVQFVSWSRHGGHRLILLWWWCSERRSGCVESHLSDWPTVGPAPSKNWTPAALAAFLSDQPRNPERERGERNMNLA